jgi:4-amino-4-deoxy-L-arabinose transferase-like glycosyltransferase
MKRALAAPNTRRSVRPQSYAWIFLLFAAVIVPAHFWMVRLPYFWDEAGQFVPAGLDLLHDGSWIPHSTTPNIHPPGLPAYLAGVWRVAGFHAASTRIGMLLLASLGALAAFLLAIELTRDAKGTPAFLAAMLLCISPVFYAQAVMAQLDMPAMLFTTVALLLFLQNHFRAAAGVCVALVLFKETGAIVPMVLGAWLVKERRWRDAVWFALPLVAIAGWVAILARRTGSWAGNADFAHYNVLVPLAPGRMLITLPRRLYFVLIANFHWAGTAAAIVAWRTSRLFRSRAWQIAGLVTAAHVLLFTVVGGAVLNRYLLPVLPIVFAAMAAALSVLPRWWRIGATAVLAAGLAASNFVNPPYPFPFEENVSFADFVRLHAEAADYIAHWYPNPVVHTAWPMTDELSRPELGYVPRKFRVQTLPNFSVETIGALDWGTVEILVVFSRDWDPPFNLARIGPMPKLWERIYGFVPAAREEEARSRVPFAAEASFTRRGQWVDVYVNPAYRKLH